MTREVKIYKCFIASPSDTSAEREICDAIFSEISGTLGEEFNFRVESIRWERDAVPDMSNKGQTIINEQLLNNFDLFIGILYSRMGTATEKYNSGTEEEFYTAYDLHKKSPSDLRIMMYFNTEAIDQNSIDDSQFKKLTGFKQFCKRAGLCSEYSGCADFREKLRTHLNKYFARQIPKFTPTSGVSTAGILQQKLEAALKSFGHLPTWVERTLCKPEDVGADISKNVDKKFDIAEFIKNPHSLIIQAPPQFGLTCLSYHLAIEAWKNGSTWIRLDAKDIKQHEIDRSIKKQCQELGVEESKINCIILDSWEPSTGMKLLRNLCGGYEQTPIIVMRGLGNFDSIDAEKISIEREFKTLALIHLPKNEIRKMVSGYNSTENINGEDDVVLNKIVKDLEVLNIHRTPLNCLTLLKISERHFDENPVNRTRMIEMILFALFNLYNYPIYSAKPDVKDCEFVLGFFCEQIVKSKEYNFSKNYFVKTTESHCKDKLLDLDVHIVFETLCRNNIIVESNSDFSFKASFWIYYFVARRMYHDENFRDYILDGKYTSFPEAIEFYTGIDRRRANVVMQLTDDLKNQRAIVEQKLGLPADMNLNLLENLRREHSKKDVDENYQRIQNSVKNSNLPGEIKDNYADQSYDQLKPYDQGIYDFFEQYAVLALLKKICASSRALRNSDYIEPKEKERTLNEIIKGWKLFSTITFILLPMLTARGRASFGGFSLRLDSSFDEMESNEKFKALIVSIPFNVFKILEINDGLYSEKLSQLFYKAFSSETDGLIKFYLVLLLIHGRPKNWEKKIYKYIGSINPDSAYLSNLQGELATIADYDFINNGDLAKAKHLIKMCHARYAYQKDKHWFDKVELIPKKLPLPKKLRLR